MCFNLFFDIEEIEIDFQQILKFQDCYVTLIKCLYDWSQFTGPDAKIFDDCEQSSKEEITMFDTPFPEYTLYQLGQESETLQRQGYECKPRIDIIPVLPQNPVTSKLIVNFLSYFGLGNKNGTLVEKNVSATTPNVEN